MEKTHLIFCCNGFCRDHELAKLKELHQDAVFNLTKGMLATKDNVYYFIVDPVPDLEKVHGLMITSYRTCGNVDTHSVPNMKGGQMIKRNKTKITKKKWGKDQVLYQGYPNPNQKTILVKIGMNFKTAIDILGMESIVDNNDICYSANSEKYASLDWSNSVDSGARAAMDGEFSVDELEAVAWWMRNFKRQVINTKREAHNEPNIANYP